MKRKKPFVLPALFLSLALVCPPQACGEPAGRNLIPMKQKLSLVSLEKLEAEYFPANKVVSVKGRLKNISSTTLRGYVTLYLLSSSGTVLGAFDLPVNEHRPFNDGETVFFDTAVNVSNVSGAYQVSLDFTQD